MVYKIIGQNWLNLTQMALLLVSVEAKSYNAVNKNFSVKGEGRCEVVLSSHQPLTYLTLCMLKIKTYPYPCFRKRISTIFVKNS